jgi:RNA polymerase sigma-70 factor, ECF subfamily
MMVLHRSERRIDRINRKGRRDERGAHIHKPVAGLCSAQDSDEELVQSARSGCKTALVELWRRHSSTVFRAAYRIVKNREYAEDLAQETFLKAFAHLQSFNGTSKFSTWLVRIGINAALGELRRRRSRPEASFDGLNNGDSQRHWEIPDRATDIEADLIK